MGLHRTDYIMFGVRLGVIEDISDDRYLPYIEGHKGVKFHIIETPQTAGVDYIAGHIIARSDGDAEFMECLPDNIVPDDIDEIMIEMKRVLGDDIEEPYAYFFTTWT